MVRREFTGSQDTDTGTIDINGYINTLQKTEEIHLPVSGLITMCDKDMLSHTIKGNFTQIILSCYPQLTFYTDNGLGKKFYYHFESANYDANKNKLVYNGIYCPINKETIFDIAMLVTPKISRSVSLEFVLENKDVQNFLSIEK